MSSQPDFDEAKEHYELELTLRDSLESKANNMAAVAGAVAALLFGFGQFMVEKLTELHYDQLNFITGLLVFGISASTGAIVFSVLGFRIQKYSYVIGKKNIERSGLQKFTATDSTTVSLSVTGQIDQGRIDAYVESIKINAPKNDTKRSLIQCAQWAFFVSLITVPIVVGWLLVHPIQFPQ